MSIKNCVKKYLKECLKEEKMYTITDDELAIGNVSRISAASTVRKLRLTLNVWEDRIECDKRAIEKVDLDLMRIDLELLDKNLAMIESVWPSRY